MRGITQEERAQQLARQQLQALAQASLYLIDKIRSATGIHGAAHMEFADTYYKEALCEDIQMVKLPQDCAAQVRYGIHVDDRSDDHATVYLILK